LIGHRKPRWAVIAKFREKHHKFGIRRRHRESKLKVFWSKTNELIFSFRNSRRTENFLRTRTFLAKHVEKGGIFEFFFTFIRANLPRFNIFSLCNLAFSRLLVVALMSICVRFFTKWT
jgi:hypothetical protein